LLAKEPHVDLKKSLEAAKKIVEHAGRHLAQRAKDDKDPKEISTSKLDAFQTAAYDLAWMSSEVYAAEQLVAYAQKNTGDVEKALAELFTAETVTSISQKLSYRFHEFGVDEPKLRETIWNVDLTKSVEKVLTSENYSRIAKLIGEKGVGTYALGD